MIVFVVKHIYVTACILTERETWGTYTHIRELDLAVAMSKQGAW